MGKCSLIQGEVGIYRENSVGYETNNADCSNLEEESTGRIVFKYSCTF